jgi:hypothetical protein
VAVRWIPCRTVAGERSSEQEVGVQIRKIWKMFSKGRMPFKASSDRSKLEKILYKQTDPADLRTVADFDVSPRSRQPDFTHIYLSYMSIGSSP